MAHRHLERLTSFDTSFLANERANGHMAIGAVLMCEGEAPGHEEFIAHLRGRLHQVPRLRQRLLQPPWRLGTPFWVDDPDFGLDRHVKRATLGQPGDDERFAALVGELLAPPLERAKPLWELVLVEGFADERFAIVYRTHHAMADGISAVDIGMLLFDVEPETGPSPAEAPWSPARTPSRWALVRAAAAGLLAAPGRVATWLRRAREQPARAARRAGDGIAGLWEVAWNLARPAPAVPFNRPIGDRRGFAWASHDLDDFKRIKNAFGGTVNDVSLAVVAGALRRWLGEQGVRLDGLELKALVPVSVRSEDERGELGNKLTAMRGPLPVGIEDPVERLRSVSVAMDRLKASKQPYAAEAIWGVNDWWRDFAPQGLLRPTAAINFSTRLFNLLVTNFPGPQVGFYVLGRPLARIYPIGFLAKDHGLAIAILSYDGQVGFGLLADPAAVPDADRLVDHLEAAVEELRSAAQVASPGDGDELAGDPRPGFARERERLA
ncbi:MAG: wax ester/triacylglycerol synthase family O-acyltransferase [Solirubrobacterales bacterium]